MKSDLLSASLIDDDVFRAATLRQTLSLARRRRRLRARRSTAAGAALLAVVASLVFHKSPPVTPVAAKEEPRVLVVQSGPLPASQRVHTAAKLFTSVATSAAGLAIVQSQHEPMTLIAAETSAPQVYLLSDHQLLAAFPAERPALIAQGTRDIRLVFY